MNSFGYHYVTAAAMFPTMIAADLEDVAAEAAYLAETTGRRGRRAVVDAARKLYGRPGSRRYLRGLAWARAIERRVEDCPVWHQGFSRVDWRDELDNVQGARASASHLNPWRETVPYDITG
jgi:hypothetical protein